MRTRAKSSTVATVECATISVGKIKSGLLREVPQLAEHRLHTGVPQIITGVPQPITGVPLLLMGVPPHLQVSTIGPPLRDRTVVGMGLI